MNSQNLQQPLDDAELDRLAEFLEAAGPKAMNIETLDGFFSALICSPEPRLPSEYLTEVWGDGFVFSDNEQLSDVINLLMRHWNHINSTLRGTLTDPDVYLPVLLENSDGVATGNDWANGFMHGVSFDSEPWGALFENEDSGGVLIPIMILAHEHDPEPSMRPEPLTPEKREKVLATMIGGLPLIYRFFEPMRRRTSLSETLQAPYRREVKKQGRNDVCLCGSGKKYKQCCGKPGTTLH